MRTAFVLYAGTLRTWQQSSGGFADFMKFQWNIVAVELHVTKRNQWAEKQVLEVRISDGEQQMLRTPIVFLLAMFSFSINKKPSKYHKRCKYAKYLSFTSVDKWMNVSTITKKDELVMA